MITKKLQGRPQKTIEITYNELRQLLHWARFGVRFAYTGSYRDTIIFTIQEYTRKIKDAPEKITFGEYRK